jgi:hypothetical protein
VVAQVTFDGFQDFQVVVNDKQDGSDHDGRVDHRSGAAWEGQPLPRDQRGLWDRRMP